MLYVYASNLETIFPLVFLSSRWFYERLLKGAMPEKRRQDNFKLGDYADVVVAINPDDELRESGDNLKIEIEYEINYFMPGVGYVLPESIGSDATIRVE